MTRPRTSHNPAPATAACPHTPGMLWGQTLPVAPSTSDDFEARVEAAWRHLKAGYFAAEEHERLREVLGVVIAKELSESVQMDEPSRAASGGRRG
jgi:hypothetical protein